MKGLPDSILDSAVQFGLEEQGHIATVEILLGLGFSWATIGEVINWHGPTAREYYERYCRLNGQPVVETDRRRVLHPDGFHRPGELEARIADLEALLTERGIPLPPERG